MLFRSTVRCFGPAATIVPSLLCFVATGSPAPAGAVLVDAAVLCVGVLAGVDAAVELLLELLLEPQPASNAAATLAVAARVSPRVISPPDCWDRLLPRPSDALAPGTFPLSHSPSLVQPIQRPSVCSDTRLSTKFGCRSGHRALCPPDGFT